MTGFQVTTALSLGLIPNMGIGSQPREPLSKESVRSTKPIDDHQIEELKAEVERMVEENRKLNEASVSMQEECAFLRDRVVRFCDRISTTTATATEIFPSPSSPSSFNTRKRKAREMKDEGRTGMNYGKQREGDMEIKIKKVHVKTDPMDNSLNVNDGYQWRKYGQKAAGCKKTPRAYFRCSFHPRCPAKRKVQRSTEESSILIVTYEGEHSHQKTSVEKVFINTHSTCHEDKMPMSSDVATFGSSKIGECQDSNVNYSFHCNEIIAEQMASSLSKDPNFTGILAAALCERMQQFCSDVVG